MKEVDRRSFLKVLGTGLGAAAIASSPAALVSSASSLAGGRGMAFSFSAEAPLPASPVPSFATLVLRGHVAAGDRESGFLNQRIVVGSPPTPRAEALPRLGLSGRVDRVQNGPTIEIWGTVDDVADPRLMRGRNFHLTIDRALGRGAYTYQGRSYRLQLKEFNER